MHVWLPSQEWADRLADAVPDLSYDIYDGTGDPPASRGATDFYVVPSPTSQAAVNVISAMPTLRAVQTLAVGVDAVRPAIPPGVSLCNARDVFHTATAELTLALVLAGVRRLPHFVRVQERRVWDHAASPDFSPGLADRTVLIVGYGSTGQAIEERLRGFETAEILRVARTPRDGVAGVAALPELLPRADVVILIVPLTDETHGLVDADFLRRMKDGSLLVNMARGPVVVTDDLVPELTSGRLSAALDVTDPEPLPTESPLWTLPNVLVTPHVAGAATPAYIPRLQALLHEQLRRFAAGKPLLNVVSGSY